MKRVLAWVPRSVVSTLCIARGPGCGAARCMFAAIVVVIGFQLAPHALAGGAGPGVGSIVHDPTAYLQHVRNVQSALVAEGQRAQQILQQGQSLLVEVRQYEAMLRQGIRLPVDDLLSTRGLSLDNLQQVAGYLRRLESLGGSVEALRAEALRTQQAHALSRLTWPEFVERERHLAGQRMDRQGEAFADAQRTMRRAEAEYAEVRSLQSRIPHTEGAHQSLQMLNHQMSLLIAQNAGFKAQIAQRDAREAREATLAEAMAARSLRVREIEQAAAEQRTQQAITAAARARARASEAIEARRLPR